MINITLPLNQQSKYLDFPNFNFSKKGNWKFFKDLLWSFCYKTCGWIFNETKECYRKL